MLDTNRRDNWCPPGVLLWLVGDRGVPPPSQTGYCRKFENGLAPRLGEAWGGPTRESVLLQLLANSVSHLLVPVNGYLCRQRQQWCVS
jgi:hypothetical protein